MKSERETNHKRLLTIGNKLRVVGEEVVRGWGNWVMGIRVLLNVMSIECYMQLMNLN